MVERNETDEPAWVREAVSRGSPRLHRLIGRAVETADLFASDVFTLGDWLPPLDGESTDDLGLLLVALFLAVGEGSLALELSPRSLHRRLEDLCDESELTPWSERALAAIRAGRFGHVIGDGLRREGADRHPLLMWTNGERQFLYFQKHLRSEEELFVKLHERAARPSRPRAEAEVAGALAEVLPVIRGDADQLTAVGLSLLRDLVIVSGGPGTGKTSVALTILRTLARLGVKAERIALAAPTGRAARRLTDAIRQGLESLGGEMHVADLALAKLRAITVHSLLDFDPGRNLCRRHEENPIAADIVLVDEVSMVSVELMAKILRALEPSAQLVLLGDKDQLPSVDAGAMLGHLIPDGAGPGLSEAVRRQIERWMPAVGTLAAGEAHWLRDGCVVLRTNHRSEQGIREAAQAINRQDADAIFALPKFAGDWTGAERDGGCWWWPQTTATPLEIRAQIQSWAEHVYAATLPEGDNFLDRVRERTLADGDTETADGNAWLSRLFRALDRARLLTLVREGAWGCVSINELMLAWLRRRLGERREQELPSGTPVLVTRNDATRGLANGDVGLAVAGQDGSPRVVFARAGGFESFALGGLPSHELGFALTVHKSQGSEFGQTLMVLPPTGGRRLMTKEMLYTGITRAKGLAVVSGTAEALRAAIGRRVVRESAMYG